MHLLLFLVFDVILVQALMFPPSPGPDCRDNGDCDSDCCLMTRMRHRRPYGLCQPLPAVGDFCAPGDRLRDYSGWRVYTHSCPCRPGLECVPEWSRRFIALSVSQDPQCMPANLSAVELHVRGFRRPPVLPPSVLRPPTPRFWPDVRTPPPL
ncbi:Prokineticin domain [Trinorchestia longiramus]|nr:Prokineticin domain [Trinorchestia longiramus]